MENDDPHAQVTEGPRPDKPRRLRRSVYGERVTVSFRIPQPVHSAMLAYAESAFTPTNTWVVHLIEEELRRLGYLQEIRGPFSTKK